MSYPHIGTKTFGEILREYSAPVTYAYCRSAKAMRCTTEDGESMTPGEAARRYLSCPKQCGRTWPRCPHL